MEKWNLIIYAPAYNVEKTISELIERMDVVRNHLAGRNISSVSFIIVNDGSTDGTREMIKEYAEKLPYLILLDKKKNGGATAALFDGMERAASLVANTERTIVVRMDSDLEHQPEDIPKLIEPIILKKTRISVGYLPFDYRNGLVNKWFNQFFGSVESRQFLGLDIPQFCPGFNAIRADTFKKLYPVLKEKNRDFEKVYGMEMLTIDFIILVIARKFEEKIDVVRLKPIEDRWIKKSPISKILFYWDYHKKTIDFFG